ncbi:MAG TPA: peptide chain release factor N(5)-glutamine methyltransferase [Quisquiliibacterium sp.]|nr:peptide chain release factor N(5)-glutamine methyltransferase [Quisquiliibacterium sp.]
MPSHDALIASSSLPRIEARALLEHASGRRREWLIAHGDEDAGEDVAERFAELARRRRLGEPLAYLVGWREFHGRRFEVTADVLIPRADTELAVRWACSVAPRDGSVLDLGTGSGAIAASVALERPDLRVLATDASAAAAEVASRNCLALGAVRVEVRIGDWFAPIRPDERFDVVVSNPPYLAADDPHLGQGDLRFEPSGALTDGADGLQALQAIVAGAASRLRDDGWLGLEHGWTQGAAVRSMLSAAGFGKVGTLRDDEGRERLTAGRRCAGAEDAG